MPPQPAAWAGKVALSIPSTSSREPRPAKVLPRGARVPALGRRAAACLRVVAAPIPIAVGALGGARLLRRKRLRQAVQVRSLGRGGGDTGGAQQVATLPREESLPLRTQSASDVLKPALEGTTWALALDVGRTPFTLMPLGWAIGGVRLELPLHVRFLERGQLELVSCGEFLGVWAEPPEGEDDASPLVRLLPALQLFVPRPLDKPLKPSLSGGSWYMAEDRTVRFKLETSGFRRESLWVPRGSLHFRARVFGQMLSPGKDAAINIRQSRAAIGLAVGVFAGLTISLPVSALCGFACAWALREVPITVGEWSCKRIEDQADVTTVAPARLVKDDARKWQ